MDPPPPDTALQPDTALPPDATLPPKPNVRLRVSRYDVPENEPEPHEISVVDLAHRLVSTDIESVSLMCVAPRRAGKSYYVKWLMYYMTALQKKPFDRSDEHWQLE